MKKEKTKKSEHEKIKEAIILAKREIKEWQKFLRDFQKRLK